MTVDDPDVAFQVEGDDRWFEATALFVMEEADPDWVRELLEDEGQEATEMEECHD